MYVPGDPEIWEVKGTFKRGTPSCGLYGDAPPESGGFLRVEVYKSVGKSQFYVYKRVGKS